METLVSSSSSALEFCQMSAGGDFARVFYGFCHDCSGLLGKERDSRQRGRRRGAVTPGVGAEQQGRKEYHKEEVL